MDKSAIGWGSGLLGILIFSGTLPATRVAIGGFDPVFLTAARTVIAALIGALALGLLRQAMPSRGDFFSLVVVALGAVVGFPLLTALALEHNTAARSTVFVGLLPLTTAIFGSLRGGETPHPVFWLFSLAGAAGVAIFALTRGGDGSLTGDLFMLAAVAVCGPGYAEGAILARKLGGWQVICWALVLSLPLVLLLAAVTRPEDWYIIAAPAWMGLGYVSVFSMLLGFVFWYRGLALGGITGVSQLQLLQPFMSLVLAALVLHEAVELPMILAAGFVVLCVAGAKRFA